MQSIVSFYPKFFEQLQFSKLHKLSQCGGKMLSHWNIISIIYSCEMYFNKRFWWCFNVKTFCL